ncbi:MAG: metallophosphoesterase [Planctomycetota bacterium]|nr:metallophosphoesterase [Planctomycetota bacterium]
MKIAHFSDVHFTRKPGEFPLRDLMSKRGMGWLNLTVRRRYKRFVAVAQVVGAFLRDLQVVKPDLILFTGDLTAVAYPQEFEAAAEAFLDLRKRTDVLGVPGNHDVYVRKANGEQLFADLFGNWLRSDCPDHSGENFPLPAVRLLGDEVAVVAVPSARPCKLADSSGFIGEERLKAVEKTLKEPDIAGRRVILALHYGFFLENGKPDKKSHGLRDADELLEVAKNNGVDLIVHGHIHERFVHQVGEITPVAIANAGSLTDKKFSRSFHVIESTDNGFDLRVRRYDETLNQFVSWLGAPGSSVIPFAALPIS